MCGHSPTSAWPLSLAVRRGDPSSRQPRQRGRYLSRCGELDDCRSRHRALRTHRVSAATDSPCMMCRSGSPWRRPMPRGTSVLPLRARAVATWRPAGWCASDTDRRHSVRQNLAGYGLRADVPARRAVGGRRRTVPVAGACRVRYPCGRGGRQLGAAGGNDIDGGVSRACSANLRARQASRFVAFGGAPLDGERHRQSRGGQAACCHAAVPKRGRIGQVAVECCYVRIRQLCPVLSVLP